MYLVREYTTISAPNSKGLWKYEVKNVLSTATIMSLLRSCTNFETASISTTLMRGLVGVSIHTSLVLLLIDSDKAFKSVGSTKVGSSPSRAPTCL